jgi:hypothetical protein
VVSDEKTLNLLREAIEQQKQLNRTICALAKSVADSSVATSEAVIGLTGAIAGLIDRMDFDSGESLDDDSLDDSE